MKVLFLDVDGVLNSTRSTLARTGPLRSHAARLAFDELLTVYHEDESIPYGPKFTLETIDTTAVGLVNRLLDKSEAHLVISSSHRGYLLDFGQTYRGEKHMQRLNLYFAAMGITHEICDITPRIYQTRGHDVEAWLEAHPGVDRHVCLDDASDFHSHHNLVKCDPKVGFSSENYYEACRHLLVKESVIIY